METTGRDTRRLGASGVTVSALGVGTWAWGDKSFWGYGKTYTRADIAAAFRESVAMGVGFFDTAEIYGRGVSERFVGAFARANTSPVVIATKYAPLPNRFSAAKLPEMLDRSLARLGVAQVGLYQIHWALPYPPIEDLMDALAGAVQAGKVRAVGVSNYTADQMRRAHARLATHGVPLASNQVRYNLLHRQPERDEVLAACRTLDVALIAYSPLAQGLLTGKRAASADTVVAGPRRFSRRFRRAGNDEIRPVLDALKAVADVRGKTVEQVALNWLLNRDDVVIPIPGAKTAAQAHANAGALGWRLTAAEMATLDAATG